MTSNELVQVWGSDLIIAKRLIIGNSQVNNWQGKTQLGDGMEYDVWCHRGATLLQLLEGVEAILAGIPEEDQDGRTIIVQVIIKTFFHNIYQFYYRVLRMILRAGLGPAGSTQSCQSWRN